MSLIQEKKYHLFQNILYVYKGVARHKPYLIALLFVSIISTAGSKFIWLFLSKYIIEFICDGMAVPELVQVVVLLTIANVLCMLLGVVCLVVKISLWLLLLSLVAVGIQSFCTSKINQASQEVFEKTPAINKFYSYIYTIFNIREQSIMY